MSSQQGQAHEYFSSVAQDWQSKSVNAGGGYSVIDGRHGAVLDVIARAPAPGRFLDVGCGTGQLAIEIAGRGWESEGLDFAREMIDQCNANAREAGNHVRFQTASFFDAELEENSYDVISAQGFIEYISTEETDEFFRRCAKLLRPGGALAVGSRNRLFNLFSLNDFTKQEVELGTLGTLMAEAIALQSSATAEDAYRELRRLARLDPQPDRHPVTGILVDTRYQFSPADLSLRLDRAGLQTHTLYPVHFHALPSGAKADNPGLHSEIALEIGRIGLRDHRLVPQSSSFVLEARRVG